MAIRMTGLNSGLNTESIVAALMSAQRTKQTKIENKKTKLEWKQEVWSSLNTKIYDFYKGSLAKIRMQSNYRTKAATSSNTSKVTATASTSAATGNYSIKVKHIASAQSVTGGKISGARQISEYVEVGEGKGNYNLDEDGNYIKVEDGKGKYEAKFVTNAATSKSKLVDLVGADGSSKFTENTQIKITTGENAKIAYFDVGENTTIQNFVDKLTGMGLNASFDEKQQRFFISSNKSGAGKQFTISSSEMTEEQKTASDKLKELIGYSGLSSANKTTADNIMAGLESGKKTVDDVIEQLTTLANNKTEKDVKQKATDFYTAVAKQEATKKLDDDIKASLEGSVSGDLTDAQYVKYLNDNGYKIKDRDDYKTDEEYAEAVKSAKDKYIEKQTKALLKEDKYKDNISNAIENGLDKETIEKEKLDSEKYKTEDFIFENRMDRTLKTNIDIEKAAKDYRDIMQSTDENVNGDALKSLGLDNITIDKDGNFTVDGKDADKDIDKDGNFTAANDTDMAVVTAKDTEIIYNGAVMTSDTTNISVGGLELNILSKTADDETINISVTNDTSAIYDTIKDFISEYNSILTEMNKYYGADSAKGYDVLTDEEKDAMSESEVEKWESKIKDSLLRRDTTLSGIVSSFRNNMMGVATASNGKRYALSSLGISTSGDYAEGGLLHIRGDEDDSEYADEENVLKKMLDEDPDTVMQVLTKLSDNLYQDLQKKMSSNKLSAAFTFYNDKEMSSQLSDYKKDISKWQDKLNEIEDRYYKQFTAMEKALANMQSQQNSLANLLGG